MATVTKRIRLKDPSVKNTYGPIITFAVLWMFLFTALNMLKVKHACTKKGHNPRFSFDRHKL